MSDSAAQTSTVSTRASQRLGRYALLAPVGQGSMGMIHLAASGDLGELHKLVIVKELRAELACSVTFVQKFLAEAKLAARLDHPNVIQTLEVGQDGARYFIAMEHLEGQSLQHWLRRTNSAALSLPLRLLILCEVLAGLHHAHELRDYDDRPLQIVHRGISPANVFLTYHGQVKVVDFGIAEAVDSEHGTKAGIFKGKFAYAAPEQISAAVVDRRCDVFAVGVMLWELLTDRRFALGSPSKAAIEARLQGSEPRAAAAAPQHDAELAAICDRALHVDVEQRYATAEAFRVALEGYLTAHGGRPQAQELGALLRREFAAERELSQRLIRKRMHDQAFRDRHLRAVVRTLAKHAPPSPVPAPEAESTSSVARRLQTSAAITTQTRLLYRHKPKTRLGLTILSVAAVVTFAAAFVWVRAELTPKLTDTLPVLRPRAAAPQASARSEPAAELHETPNFRPEAPAAPPKAAVAISSSRRSTRAHSAAARPAQPAAASKTHEAQTQAPAASATQPEPRARTAAAAPQLGDDLRSQRAQHPSRQIEREDPFR